jgi:hypothetical protein
MRSFASRDSLAPFARATLPQRTLLDVTRLTGGSNKGVYRLTFDDDSTCLAYRWHADESFWLTEIAIAVGPFGRPAGPAEFVEKHAMLSGLGVRVPGILGLDGDVALIEDVRGGTLEALIARDPAAGRVVLDRLADALYVMHTSVRDDFGFPGRTSEEFVVERGRRALAEAAPREPRIGAAADQLADELTRRYDAVEPRRSYGVIHGELGLDHVMVAGDEPVLIDIEGAMVFDIEWEHAFMELRLGALYPVRKQAALDPDRLALCGLTHYLSLVAGPLQLLDGDFPRRDGMLEIVEGNVARTLACLGTVAGPAR